MNLTEVLTKRSSKKQIRKDPDKIAAYIVEVATSEPGVKNPAAVAPGRPGGLKGDKARAANLTSARRVEIAKKAAQARWGARRTIT